MRNQFWFLTTIISALSQDDPACTRKYDGFKEADESHRTYCEAKLNESHVDFVLWSMKAVSACLLSCFQQVLLFLAATFSFAED